MISPESIVPDPPTAAPADAAVRPSEEEVREAFRAFVDAEDFSCLGARAALHRPHHHIAVYGAMGSPKSTAALARDLRAFAADAGAEDFATFVAVFPESVAMSEVAFEDGLWDQLQCLSATDAASEWDPAVSADPDDPHFSFSFAGTAFFVVGLHPEGSRLARRFVWPALAFNPHAQFERLRANGRYYTLRETIRARELTLQGSLNPNLSDFGERSDARQYAGRAVDDTWRCPFHRDDT